MHFTPWKGNIVVSFRNMNDSTTFKIPHSKPPNQILLLKLQKYPWTDVFKVAHIVVIKFNALT